MSTKPRIQQIGRLANLFTILCSIAFALSQTSAQSSSPPPIYTTNGYISHLSWSVDGGAIAFGDEGWYLCFRATTER